MRGLRRRSSLIVLGCIYFGIYLVFMDRFKKCTLCDIAPVELIVGLSITEHCDSTCESSTE